ncbi:hypothetical protein L2E82_25504 [Cichorium intybus]|uniref:Uncharacterized protein n=1 Tax=Cichorium intybus TaxID=13427 RepID=A0ACB9E3U7_CICIN|nr:hypothetical protein L2E82_25504 [Cichorium intybus]
MSRDVSMLTEGDIHCNHEEMCLIKLEQTLYPMHIKKIQRSTLGDVQDEVITYTLQSMIFVMEEKNKASIVLGKGQVLATTLLGGSEKPIEIDVVVEDEAERKSALTKPSVTAHMGRG